MPCLSLLALTFHVLAMVEGLKDGTPETEVDDLIF